MRVQSVLSVRRFGEGGRKVWRECGYHVFVCVCVVGGGLWLYKAHSDLQVNEGGGHREESLTRTPLVQERSAVLEVSLTETHLICSALFLEEGAFMPAACKSAGHQIFITLLLLHCDSVPAGNSALPC